MVALTLHCRLSSVCENYIQNNIAAFPDRSSGLFTNRHPRQRKHHTPTLLMCVCTCTLVHRHNGGKHTSSLFAALCSVWHLSTSASDWQSLWVKPNCLLSKVSWKQACLNNYSINHTPAAPGAPMLREDMVCPISWTRGQMYTRRVRRKDHTYEPVFIMEECAVRMCAPPAYFRLGVHTV